MNCDKIYLINRAIGSSVQTGNLALVVVVLFLGVLFLLLTMKNGIRLETWRDIRRDLRVTLDSLLRSSLRNRNKPQKSTTKTQNFVSIYIYIYILYKRCVCVCVFLYECMCWSSVDTRVTRWRTPCDFLKKMYFFFFVDLPFFLIHDAYNKGKTNKKSKGKKRKIFSSFVAIVLLVKISNFVDFLLSLSLSLSLARNYKKVKEKYKQIASREEEKKKQRSYEIFIYTNYYFIFFSSSSCRATAKNTLFNDKYSSFSFQ